MIQDVGFFDRCAVDLLISVHELLKKQEGYDRFDLLCLLRAASLISAVVGKRNRSENGDSEGPC